MNVKQVRIVGQIPFDFMDEIDTVDLAVLAQTFARPSAGLKLVYGESHLRNNADGSPGQTTWYHLRISGETSASWKFLQQLLGIFVLGGAELKTAHAIDIEDKPSSWEDIHPATPVGRKIFG